MSRIFWDTNLFIYLIEGEPSLKNRAIEMVNRMTERRDQLFTSTITLGEVLVRPLASGNRVLVESYEDLLSRGAVLLPFERETARAYARIRTDLSIRAPDAIQLACAATQGVDLFITNDRRLSRKVIPGISFITSFAEAPL
jgi:predicted nucleic acid-binding protein